MRAAFPKPLIRFLPCALLCAVPLHATPSINTPTVTPVNLTVNQPIQVTASCKINMSAGDPALLPGGVNLVRLTATGAAGSTIGVMHDDGLNGDAVAGDGVFTYQYTDTETATGQFQLQCTAAFQGVLQRVRSPAVTMTVVAAPGSLSALTISPASIAFGVATPVNISTTITGATPDDGSVMLQRLDSAGRVTAILGTLQRSGNTGTFTLAAAFAEFAVGPISLRVSATFSGAVSHVFTPVGTLTVTGTPPPTVTITTPANLSFLNISPTTVTGTVSDSMATVVINSIAAPVVNGTFTASVPLAEGPNILTATATSASGSVGSGSITVTLDTTPPHVTITSPTDQFVTTDSSISVAGNVNDTVVGTVNSQQAQVKVNGIAAQVANRTFLATNVPLNMGSNTIQAVAVDRAGNPATTQITIIRQAPQPGQIQLISGNNQTAGIGTTLSAPLVISLTDPSGNPAANKPVIFAVTQNNGMLTVAGGTPAATIMANTNAEGQATVTWKLGMRSGAGSDGVQAYSMGYSGTAVFAASANQGTPGMIVIDSGNNQTGPVNQALAKPFIAVVTDAGFNRLANVPVTFRVSQGSGSFAGQPSTSVNTDSDGRAAATLVLGFQEGISNNLVTADFPGNTGFPATFTASGVGPGDPANTVISGLVLDNSNQPIPGVSVRTVLTNILNSNLGAVQTAAAVQTDARGQFSITNAPVGFVKLFVDGSTATVPGVFPTLDYDMVTVAGQTNTVGQSIYLLPIKTTNQLCVTTTTGGGTLSIPEAPGFSLTFGPGQVTFPGGSKTGCVSVTVVHPDKVPMVPGFGQQPRFIVTIQPSGALFNPPAPITLPNVDGLAPRAVTEMYSFDHDIGSFVAIGTGTVSDDGLVIRSDRGVGVLKAGWHCGGNPNQPGTVATCPVCSFCQGTTCTPQGNGTPCGNGGNCQFTGRTTAPVCVCPTGQVFDTTTGTCVSTAPCQAGYSLVNGRCCQGATCMPPQCPAGLVFDPATGTCVNNSPCPPGYTLFNGQCCQGNSCVPPQCPPGLTFNAATGTCQALMCGNGQTCSSPNPCIDASCGANNQCMFMPNQTCQNACHGATSGPCSVNGVSGMCDASGNCNLCGNPGITSCTCGGGGIGTCSGGQCTGCPVAFINILSTSNTGIFVGDTVTIQVEGGPLPGSFTNNVSWDHNVFSLVQSIPTQTGSTIALTLILKAVGVGVASNVHFEYSTQAGALARADVYIDTAQINVDSYTSSANPNPPQVFFPNDDHFSIPGPSDGNAIQIQASLSILGSASVQANYQIGFIQNLEGEQLDLTYLKTIIQVRPQTSPTLDAFAANAPVLNFGTSLQPVFADRPSSGGYGLNTCWDQNPALSGQAAHFTIQEYNRDDLFANWLVAMNSKTKNILFLKNLTWHLHYTVTFSTPSDTVCNVNSSTGGVTIINTGDGKGSQLFTIDGLIANDPSSINITYLSRQ
jgi:hypothetical protein